MFTKNYFAYRQVPVDLRFWSLKLEEIIKNKINETSFNDSSDKDLSGIKSSLDEIKNIIDFRDWSVWVIKNQLWRKDDDMRQEWFFFVPWENDMIIGYMMKQDNNWTTYIVSPVKPQDPSIAENIVEVERKI